MSAKSNFSITRKLGKQSRIFVTLLIAVLISMIVGCAGSIMTTVNTIEKEPSSNVSLVTFMRPSNWGNDVAPGIWDGEQLVGTQEINSYIQYFTTPGEHVFLSKLGTSWSYVKANLSPGKQYFIITRVWAAPFYPADVILDPITRNDSEERMKNWEKISGWLASLRLMTLDKNKEKDYVSSRLASVRQALDDYKSGKTKVNVLEASDCK
ncbi:MAG: Uncharacterized protein FD156_267 [Nitrospirae bacterium]|nr:MAG: Uncharacterized protein FD156_267 [Nitrospirota bacterium]